MQDSFILVFVDMDIKINKLSITDKKSPLIIAEISGNHCGKINFLKHIKYAFKCGADELKYKLMNRGYNLRNNNYKIKSGI